MLRQSTKHLSTSLISRDPLLTLLTDNFVKFPAEAIKTDLFSRNFKLTGKSFGGGSFMICRSRLSYRLMINYVLRPAFYVTGTEILILSSFIRDINNLHGDLDDPTTAQFEKDYEFRIQLVAFQNVYGEAITTFGTSQGAVKEGVVTVTYPTFKTFAMPMV